MESILTGSTTTWYGNCTRQDWKALQWVVRSSKHTIRSFLPALQDIYSMGLFHKSRIQKSSITEKLRLDLV
ncbi:hypothetical protein LDENG_00269220 [Lucifuga dentata]|nr:hypothetical protein LDENG_00269220 [Lucifuga dentata]